MTGGHFAKSMLDTTTAIKTGSVLGSPIDEIACHRQSTLMRSNLAYTTTRQSQSLRGCCTCQNGCVSDLCWADPPSCDDKRGNEHPCGLVHPDISLRDSQPSRRLETLGTVASRFCQVELSLNLASEEPVQNLGRIYVINFPKR